MYIYTNLIREINTQIGLETVDNFEGTIDTCWELHTCNFKIRSRSFFFSAFNTMVCKFLILSLVVFKVLMVLPTSWKRFFY